MAYLIFVVAQPCLRDLQVVWGVWSVFCVVLGVVVVVVAVCRCCQPVVAGVGGAVKSIPTGRVGSFDLTEGTGPVVAATFGGDVGTTVLGEGCGLVPLMVGGGGVLNWWRIGVLELVEARLGSMGHNNLPQIPPSSAQHPE